jgi:hypothetical protein
LAYNFLSRQVNQGMIHWPLNDPNYIRRTKSPRKFNAPNLLQPKPLRDQNVINVVSILIILYATAVAYGLLELSQSIIKFLSRHFT